MGGRTGHYEFLDISCVIANNQPDVLSLKFKLTGL